MIFSSCSIFEDEVFENTDNNLMSEEDIIKEKSPPFSFFKALQSVEREEIEVKDQEVNSDRIRINHNESARIVLRYNESGVASFNRFEDGQLLASNEMLFKIKRRTDRKYSNGEVSKYFYRINVEQESFLFKENTEKKYEEAKYGVFRVGPDGDFVLVDLADKDLNKLTLIKEQ